MGWPEVAGNGRKITNFLAVHGGCRRLFIGPIPARPAAVRREIPPEGSSGCYAPPRPARVAGGASSGPISHGSQMNKKNSTWFPVWRALS